MNEKGTEQHLDQDVKKTKLWYFLFKHISITIQSNKDSSNAVGKLDVF